MTESGAGTGEDHRARSEGLSSGGSNGRLQFRARTRHLVHDDPSFIEEAAAALRTAGHDVATFMEPMEALNALEAAQRFKILITRVRFAPGKPNGVSLAQMAQAKQSGIKVLFTVAPENIEHTEGIGEFVAAPIDIPQLVTMVSKLVSQK